MMNEFSELDLDVLKEIGNIGAGHAATSLSLLLDRKIEMHVPAVKVVDFDEMMNLAGGPEERVVAVYLRIHGDAPGNMFFVLSPMQAGMFVKQMTGVVSCQFTDPPYDDMAVSAMQELGNILTGSYLTSLADFTNMNLQPSVPALAIDMVGAVLSYGLLELSQYSDQAIVVETLLVDETGSTQDIRGHFFLLPDPDSYQKIFTSLGVNAHD
ncbi:chemotaxis protein CheC [Thalassobacillus cyri]|uniref:Chemotaxis protein CheC n=1 Tax=Thalassobacillus cyri TaxID=571932 RepID=A0A1H4G017_9BACI|nr:chemotaxis protein CheC [Thalassobacillus cyri]